MLGSVVRGMWPIEQFKHIHTQTMYGNMTICRHTLENSNMYTKNKLPHKSEQTNARANSCNQNLNAGARDKDRSREKKLRDSNINEQRKKIAKIKINSLLWPLAGKNEAKKKRETPQIGNAKMCGVLYMRHTARLTLHKTPRTICGCGRQTWNICSICSTWIMAFRISVAQLIFLIRSNCGHRFCFSLHSSRRGAIASKWIEISWIVFFSSTGKKQQQITFNLSNVIECLRAPLRGGKNESVLLIANKEIYMLKCFRMAHSPIAFALYCCCCKKSSLLM